MKDGPLYWNVSKLRAKGDESEMYDVLIDTLDSKYSQKEKDSTLSLKMWIWILTQSDMWSMWDIVVCELNFRTKKKKRPIWK